MLKQLMLAAAVAVALMEVTAFAEQRPCGGRRQRGVHYPRQSGQAGGLRALPRVVHQPPDADLGDLFGGTESPLGRGRQFDARPTRV